MTASKIQMDQIRSTSATVTGENIRAGSQKKSSLSPAEGLQGASPDATCTCPSGGGSLRHPCPAHPAVEQAGGDERDFQAEGAQEVPSPVSQEYDRHLISLLRKGEALPGHQEEAADEIERLRDWNDHLNNTVLPNILNPNFLMLMKGGERLLDLCTKDGKFIGVSLNDMKDVFDWMVTHARIAPDHAALAQPSPTLPPFAEKVLAKLRRFYDCAEDFESGGVDIGRNWLDLLTQLGLLNRVQRSPALWEISQQGEDLLGTPHPSPAQAEKAEAERPEVVAYLFVKPDGTLSMDAVRHKPSQPAVAVMTVAQHERIVKAWIERWKAYIELSAKIAAQRDAALARVAELEAKLSDPTAVHQWQFSNAWFDGSEEVVLKAGKEGSPIRTLYAAPVAQAQHSVPETTNEEANSFLRVADAGQFKDNAVAVRTAAVIIRSLLHRPALMQSIIRHRIGLTPEYEGQWHADLYGEDGEVQHHAEADTPDEAVRAVVALAAAPGKEGL